MRSPHRTLTITHLCIYDKALLKRFPKANCEQVECVLREMMEMRINLAEAVIKGESTDKECKELDK